MNSKLKKLLPYLFFILIIGFLVFNVRVSKSQEFVPVRDAEVIELLELLVNKEYELDPEQRTLAGENLDLVSKFIIRDVLHVMGRKGDINDTGGLNVFVDNWRNFALGGQYRAEDLWRGILHIAANGTDTGIPPLLCDHIRNSQAINSLLPRKVDGLIESGIQRKVDSLEEYLVTANCDSMVNENFDLFMEDFAEGGGWDTWERLLQPQNNIFGAIGLAMDELERQRKIEEQSDIQEANSGSGYLGRRQCLAFGPSGQCVIWSDINIPANLAVETLGAILNQNLGFIANADEIGEVGAATSTIEILELLELIFGAEL